MGLVRLWARKAFISPSMRPAAVGGRGFRLCTSLLARACVRAGGRARARPSSRVRAINRRTDADRGVGAREGEPCHLVPAAANPFPPPPPHTNTIFFATAVCPRRRPVPTTIHVERRRIERGGGGGGRCVAVKRAHCDREPRTLVRSSGKCCRRRRRRHSRVLQCSRRCR